MFKKVLPIFFIFFLGLTSCTMSTLTESGIATPVTSPTNVPAAVSKFPLPDLLTYIPPPPIVAIPKSTARISGAAMDVYQIPGDRIRVVCKQPCALDERVAYAAFAGYKVAIQSLVRMVGFDVLDKYNPIDIYLSRDRFCTPGAAASAGSYPDNPNSILICENLTDKGLFDWDPESPNTPETAIRLGGLGCFRHEYIHSIFFGRFRANLHDFVHPIEYNNIFPSDPYYGDLCNSIYSTIAPFTYQVCQSKKLTFDQLIQSMRDMNTLYEGGYGDRYGMVSFNQYLAVLNHILSTDVRPIVAEVGYQGILSDGKTTPYLLPYTNAPCSYQSLLVKDVTIPLGTILDINTPFSKTWQVQNSGSCDWKGVQLVYVRGEAMTAVKAISVADTPAAGTVEITVPMTAPGEAGVHIGEWRLRNASGLDFGPIINLTLYTRPGCSFPPQFSFFTSEPQTIGWGALSLLSWGQVTNVDKLEIVGLGSVDPNGNRLLVQPDQTTTYTLKATCGTNTVTTQETVTVNTSLPPFKISNIKATANPAEFKSACKVNGKVINFTGSFTSNGPGVDQYNWSRNDEGISNPRVLIINQAGVQTFTSYWNLGESFSGWMEVKIIAPMESDAVRASFNLTCTS